MLSGPLAFPVMLQRQIKRLAKPFRPILQRAHYYYDKDIYGYRSPRPVVDAEYSAEELDIRNKNSNLLRLVYAYRSHGHRMANLDPLNMAPVDHAKELDPARYGIKETGDSYDLAGSNFSFRNYTCGKE